MIAPILIGRGKSGHLSNLFLKKVVVGNTHRLVRKNEARESGAETILYFDLVGIER